MFIVRGNFKENRLGCHDIGDMRVNTSKIGDGHG